MNTIKVVAAVIREQGRIFATARGYGAYKGWWEFPGGKIEAGETPEEALVREIREELDSEIEVGSLIDTIEYDYPEFHLSMDCFWCTVVSGRLTLKEASDARWLTAETIGQVKWLPADLGLVEKIKAILENPDDDLILNHAKEYIKELFQSNSGGHDVDHTMRVYCNTLKIAEQEPGCDIKTAALAALLHDADDHKLFQTENNANARAFLESQDIPEEQIENICGIINSVSFSRNKGKTPETLEGMIVQDADRLDAIGAVGIARTFAFGGEHGRPLHESIQHFYDKLLLLKDLINTDSARKIAQQRHDFLESFLKEYLEETDEIRR